VKRVLFVCTHNSARSQMAEALLREAAGADFEPHSAGTQAGELHPLVEAVMREMGVDISRQRAKSVDVYWQQPFDYVITVCDEAREVCPVFPNATRRLHWSVADPSRQGSSMDEKVAAFRVARDQLNTLVAQFVAGADK
jgi:arsenate reductase